MDPISSLAESRFHANPLFRSSSMTTGAGATDSSTTTFTNPMTLQAAHTPASPSPRAAAAASPPSRASTTATSGHDTKPIERARISTCGTTRPRPWFPSPVCGLPVHPPSPHSPAAPKPPRPPPAPNSTQRTPTATTLQAPLLAAEVMALEMAADQQMDQQMTRVSRGCTPPRQRTHTHASQASPRPTLPTTSISMPHAASLFRAQGPVGAGSSRGSLSVDERQEAARVRRHVTPTNPV
jgi:hypothetical protein